MFAAAHCPSDSYPLPPLHTNNGCCEKHQGSVELVTYFENNIFYYSVLNIVVVFILQPYSFQENNHNGRHTRTEISIDGFYIVKYVMKLSFMTAQYGTVQRLSCHFDNRCHNIGIFKFVMSTIYKMQILLVHLFPFRCLSSWEQIYLLWRNRKLCHIEISTCVDTTSD